LGDLFLRTASQSLQAFLPVAFGWAACRRLRHGATMAGVVWGLSVAAVVSGPAGWLFQQSTRQALWESSLAVLALASLVWAVRGIAAARAAPPLALSAVTVLIVTRQTMEIAAVFGVAAFQLRSLAAVLTISSATCLGAGAAGTWLWMAGRLNARAASTAERVFCFLFLGQLGMYAFHESAEARLLPWSETLHAATEPYGPDGTFGQQVSWLLIALPALTAIAASLHVKRQRIVPWRASASRGAVALGLAVVALGDGVSLRSAVSVAAVPTDQLMAMATDPYVLFRHTGVDNDYNVLSMASLADPSGRRLPTGIPCERVAFAAGRGICLQASRGVFTTYRAILIDRQFRTLASWPLDGSPSRTRVASDGRVGAITVFVTGHGYGASPFSTKTTLVDMASGDTLGDLEQFATWRDGTRVKGQDFNFWGVTFGRDSNHFYATLGTGGKTYLVKGDLGLRKLMVLHEGVECPSLSPDERLIAFKQRTGTASGRWRVAVLDLATMTERLLVSETRNIDDQVEWLDNNSLLYAVPRDGSAVTDVWVAQLNTTVPSRVLIPAAESPTVVRQATGAGSPHRP